MKSLLSLLAVLLSAPSAHAAEWSDFEEAFPLFPCPDGWMACKVDGEVVSPDLQVDGAGMPMPSNMRIGWYDLEATSAFSPFATLSEYTGNLPDGVGAAAVDVPVPAPAPAPAVAQVDNAEAEAARVAAEAAAVAREQAEKEADAARKAREAAAARAAEQKAAAAELARKAADADATERVKLEAEAAAAKKAAEEAERQRQAAMAEEKKRQDEAKRLDEERKKKEAAAAVAAKAAEEAAAAAAAQAAADAAATAAATEKKVETAAVAGDVRPAEVADCSSIVKLEPAAMMGRLSEPQVNCLEGELAAAAKMTDKGKISRVLMVNAFARGDKKEWERLVKRHLDEINQSDPDLCYKYALHLSKKGVGSSHGVIRWAEVAHENRTVWTGPTYTSRVYSLHKLKSAAAQKLWQRAESKHSSAPSDETGANVDKYRNETKVYARAWYEYAKQAGKDTTKALQLCMSAAGTSDYCEAG
jgi:hypothetical protein